MERRQAHRQKIAIQQSPILRQTSAVLAHVKLSNVRRDITLTQLIPGVLRIPHHLVPQRQVTQRRTVIILQIPLLALAQAASVPSANAPAAITLTRIKPDVPQTATHPAAKSTVVLRSTVHLTVMKKSAIQAAFVPVPKMAVKFSIMTKTHA